MGAENYTLGKGILYFDRYQNGAYSGYRDLGNAPSFSFNVNIEKLEHFSSRGGLRVKDKEIISQLTPSCSFTLDEITAENFEILGLATIDDQSQAAATGESETIAAVVGKVTLAKRGIKNVSVVAGSTTLVAGTDYTIGAADAKAGQINFIDSTDVQAAITASEDFVITYDCDAVDLKVVKLFTETEVIGRLKFVSDNPTGTQCTLVAKSVSLTPSGDTAFIGDDWSTLSFSCECLKSSAPEDADSPYIDIIMES